MSQADERSYADVAAQADPDPDPDPASTVAPAPAPAPTPADHITPRAPGPTIPAGGKPEGSGRRSSLAKPKAGTTSKTAHFDVPASWAELAGAGAGAGAGPEAETQSRDWARAPPPDSAHKTNRPPHQTSPLPPPQPDPRPTQIPIRPDLAHTAHDLTQLIKGFIFLPPFVRRLRTLIPDPVRTLARRAIRLLAMVLHNQGNHTVLLPIGSGWVL